MADKSVFTRLKRLFSTDVIIRNVGGDQIKTIDSGHVQSSGEYETNALVDRYNRIYSTAPSSLYGAQFNLNYQYMRTFIYSEYDVMDQDAIIASALDAVYNAILTVGSYDYQIYNIKRMGPVIPLGTELGTEGILLFTVNFLMTLKRVV